MDEKDNKPRETIPDVLSNLNRARNHANAIDKQLIRLETAYGEERIEKPKPDPLDHSPSIMESLEIEARELADFLLELQESLGRRLELLLGANP